MKVFCIRHGEMVYLRPSWKGHEFFHYQDGGFVNGFQYALIAFCDLPDGLAYCEPPEFNLEAYIEEFGNPDYPLDEFYADRLPNIDYDFENDEIVVLE